MERKRSSAHTGGSSSKPLSREALRKANHSMIERRRREKINHAFSELRGMVPGLGGGGEGMKGEFKLEVLERTVEHMRLLMNRLDVLESRQPQRSTQPVAEQKQARKRKRLASTPTTTTSTSNSTSTFSSDPKSYPHSGPSSIAAYRHTSSRLGRRSRPDSDREETSEADSESSEEEPLVGRRQVERARQEVSKPEESTRSDRVIPLPLPLPIRTNITSINGHSNTRHPASAQAHQSGGPEARTLPPPKHRVHARDPASSTLALSRILNPASPRPRGRLPLAAFNSPTPSRTDSEATVLEEGLPSPGSDSGLGLGMVDGIAVRMDTIQDDLLGLATGDQPTPISSLALGHHHSLSSRFAYPGPLASSSASHSTIVPITAHERNRKDLFLSNLTEMSPLSPFIIGTSSSSSTSRSSQLLPEPSPLLPPMIHRQSIAGLFELDPISLERTSASGSGSRSGSGEENEDARPRSNQVDEQEAANILLALSSPESMAPTPWHSASKGASPPGAFNLDVPPEMDVDMPLETERSPKMDGTERVGLSRTTSVTSSARGGRLAKSARDFLNLREDAFGFALTQVG